MDKKTIKDLLLIAYARQNHVARAFLQDFGGLDDRELAHIADIASDAAEAALGCVRETE